MAGSLIALCAAAGCSASEPAASPVTTPAVEQHETTLGVTTTSTRATTVTSTIPVTTVQPTTTINPQDRMLRLSDFPAGWKGPIYGTTANLQPNCWATPGLEVQYGMILEFGRSPAVFDEFIQIYENNEVASAAYRDITEGFLECGDRAMAQVKMKQKIEAKPISASDVGCRVQSAYTSDLSFLEDQPGIQYKGPLSVEVVFAQCGNVVVTFRYGVVGAFTKPKALALMRLAASRLKG